MCELEVRTKHGYWSTDCESTSQDPLLATVSDGAVGSEGLYVEVSTGDKLVRDAVRRHVQRTRVSPLKYLRFTPGQDLGAAPFMTNVDACASAHQVRQQLSRTISDYSISEVHMFAAVPQALATMLGHGMNAMPPVHLYEYDGREYHSSHVLALGSRS